MQRSVLFVVKCKDGGFIVTDDDEDTGGGDVFHKAIPDDSDLAAALTDGFKAIDAHNEQQAAAAAAAEELPSKRTMRSRGRRHEPEEDEDY